MAKSATAIADGGASSSEEASEETKSRKKIVIVLAAFVLLLAAVAAGYFLLGPSLFGGKKQASAIAKPVPGPTFALPQATTNLSDGHLIQVSVTLQLAPGSVTTGLASIEPQLQNAELQTLNSFSYSQLLSTSGWGLLVNHLVGSLSPVVGNASATPKLQTVYITDRVIQ